MTPSDSLAAGFWTSPGLGGVCAVIAAVVAGTVAWLSSTRQRAADTSGRGGIMTLQSIREELRGLTDDQLRKVVSDLNDGVVPPPTSTPLSTAGAPWRRIERD